MEIYRFETKRFAIVCLALKEDLDPADSFQFPEDIKFARSGGFAHWFCAVVEVSSKQSGCVLGRDILGGCSYRSFHDFVHGGGYFPDMVREAIGQVRESVAGLRG